MEETKDVPIVMTGKTDTDINILSYLPYGELLLLAKKIHRVKELMRNPKLWALKLKRDYNIDIMELKREYPEITPRYFRIFYISKYKMDQLLEKQQSCFFYERTIRRLGTMMSQVNRLVEFYNLTELEAKYMLILIGMGYLLDLKVTTPATLWDKRFIKKKGYKIPTFKDLVVFVLSLYYTADILQCRHHDYNNVKKAIRAFLSRNKYKIYHHVRSSTGKRLESIKNYRPDLIIIMMVYPNSYIKEIAYDFLKSKDNTAFKIYLIKKGFMKDFKESEAYVNEFMDYCREIN